MLGVVQVLGGRRALGVNVRSEFDLERLVRVGFPVAAFNAAKAHMSLSSSQSERIVSRRTTGRRQRLTPQVSERVARFARAWALAEETFGDAEKARSWFFRSIPAFRGEVPFEMLMTESGARLVERELGRLAYGVYS